MRGKFLTTIKKYNMIKKGDRIVIGVSGGADSSALLSLLVSLKEEYSLRLVVVHVNHMLRGSLADADESFVENLCDSFNVEFRSKKCDVEKFSNEKGITLEEAGRIIRYDYFYQVASEVQGTKIAVAHNMNDNAETVIMRLARGTGLKGLGGIPPVRDNIIRPLIEIDRIEIEKYCLENKIKFRNDHTNFMDIYTRNKIRISILPQLTEYINSKTIENISNTSSLVRLEDQFLDELAAEKLNLITIEKGNEFIYIDINELLKNNEVIIRRILRLALSYISSSMKDVSIRHIDSILRLLNGDNGKCINITRGIKVAKEYDRLHIFMNMTEKNEFFYKIINDSTIYIDEINKYVKIIKDFKDNCINSSVYKKVFDADKIPDLDSGICIRTRRVGDVLKLKGVGTKKLKDYFIDAKIPKTLRDSIPVVAVGNNVLWVLGYRVSDFYFADNNTRKLISIEFQEDV